MSGPDALLQGDRSSLHVISAAPLTNLSVSRRSDLNYLAITPARPGAESLLVTVLAPASSGAAAPKVSWHDEPVGRLLMIEDAGRMFSVRLRRAESWRIEAVNGEALREWTVPTRRTFTRLSAVE